MNEFAKRYVRYQLLSHLVFYTVLLHFILSLYGEWYYVTIKVLLALVFIAMIFHDWYKYSAITLVPFITFECVLFTIFYFFVGGIVGYIAIFLYLYIAWAQIIIVGRRGE